MNNFISVHAQVVKNINQRIVLKLIQENEIISSSDLVRITGMRPSTIFNILKELSAQSLVEMNGKGESTNKGGKKPYTWALNKDAAYVIGIDIEVSEMTWVLLDFSGRILARKIVKLSTGYTADELAGNIINLVNRILSENNIPSEKVLGLGVAFTGIVDYNRGVVVISSVLPEMNYPLLEKLSALPFPVVVENNANAAAIGLKRSGKTGSNYVTVLVEIDRNVSGLGIGIVINGEVYRGASYCAGELFPHMPTLREILGTIRSRFVESEIFKNHVASYESIDMDFLVDAAKQGDELAILVFTMIGNIVGQTIAQTVALFNPDTLIITGVVSELEDVLITSVRKEIEMRVISITCNAMNIIIDKRHQYSVAFGAASLVLEDFFRLPLAR